MKRIEELIRFLNQTGFEISDARDGGLGFVVRKSPHSEHGASLHYLNSRGFYVSVGSRERDTNEIRNLASALNNLADVAESLNNLLK